MQGNLIGTDKTGLVLLGNGNGLNIEAANTLIGGTAPGEGNVISGNGYGVLLFGPGATGNTIAGNLIGLDQHGAAAIPNFFAGIQIYGGAHDNVIGGTAAGAGNTISGNTGDGIRIITSGTTGNLVQGNLIGTNPGGSLPLGNLQAGIAIADGATGNTIGGLAAGMRNVISANQRGIELNATAGSNTIQGNYIGADVSGQDPLGNLTAGVIVRGNAVAQIGGTAAGAGNVISGNAGHGIWINTTQAGTIIEGNLIGLEPASVEGLGNQGAGILIDGGAQTIGGSARRSQHHRLQRPPGHPTAFGLRRFQRRQPQRDLFQRRVGD